MLQRNCDTNNNNNNKQFNSQNCKIINQKTAYKNYLSSFF